MMVDDGKRRETARRLRAAAEQADPAAGVSETEIFCILDVDLGGERGFADRQDVLRLADLIDRPATQGSGNRRAATCEDIDFLIALQEEMNTQPHVGQADPRFWVVQVSSYRDATDADDIDRVRFIDDEWIETDRMTLDEAMEAAYRAEVEVAGEEHARDIVAEFGLGCTRMASSPATFPAIAEALSSITPKSAARSRSSRPVSARSHRTRCSSRSARRRIISSRTATITRIRVHSP